MRPFTLRCPAVLGRAATLAAAALLAAPALAQDTTFTDVPSPTFKLDDAPAARPTKAGTAHKPRAARTARTAAPKAATDGTSPPGTIPMDFSGMARRGADLDKGKDATSSDGDNRPVIHNGLVPGATFKF